MLTDLTQSTYLSWADRPGLCTGQQCPGIAFSELSSHLVAARVLTKAYEGGRKLLAQNGHMALFGICPLARTEKAPRQA